MNIYYVGLDVHLATIVICVMNASGKIINESIIETSTQAVRDFFKAMRGEVHVTFEEGCHAAWLYDLIRPLVTRVIVCNPQRNKLLHTGNKSDRIDTRKLAELLRTGSLRPVYHGEHGTRALKELVHCYECLVDDTTRVKNRIKAIYRGRGIACRGTKVYGKSQRHQWLEKLTEPGVERRVESLLTQLDQLRQLRREARRAMVAEGRQHKAYKLLRRVPQLGPVRVSQIIAIIDSPYRFRTKRELWAYIGLAVVTKSSADYEIVNGSVKKRKRVVQTRGLNENYNRRLKAVFKSAALRAMCCRPYKEYYDGLISRGMRAEMARLVVARKIAAAVLAVWKRGESFDAERVLKRAA